MTNEHGRKVFCGGFHSFVLKKDKSLFGFGSNMNGQLSVSQRDEWCFFSPIFVMKEEGIFNIFCGENCSFLLMEDGILLACGDNQHNQLGIENEQGLNILKFKFVMEDVVQVCIQHDSSAVLKEGGEVLLFGKMECNKLSKKEGELQRKLEIEEPIALLSNNKPIHLEWTFENHKEFEEEFRESIRCFLLCMKRAIAGNLRPPNPILKIVINLSL